MRRSGWCYMLFFVLPTSKKFCMYDTKILQYHKCFSNNKYPWQGTSAPWPWTWHATDSAKGRPTTSTGLQVDMFICDIISVKRGRRSVQRSKNSTTKNCITKLYHIDKHGSHPSQLCLGPSLHSRSVDSISCFGWSRPASPPSPHFFQLGYDCQGPPEIIA